jgi:hypothetical protein
MRRKILLLALVMAVLFTVSVLMFSALDTRAQTSGPVIYLSSGSATRYVVYESFMRFG